MKIAIAGAHGVGKSFLTKALAQKLRYPRIDEIARDIAHAMGFKNTEEIIRAEKEVIQRFQESVFYGQLMTEGDYWDQFKCFVSDRSIFDIVGYMILYQLDSQFITDHTIMASRHSRGYDMIIYCPITCDEIANDGFRLVDKASQVTLDKALKGLLAAQAKCPVIYLPPIRDEWFNKTLESIKSMIGETA